jgi:hypothetical protein
VDVEIQSAPESLNHRHASRVAVAKAPAARASPQETMGQAQHPPAYRNTRQDAAHEAGRALGHAPAAAARAKAAALAGVRHQPLEGAVPTALPRKPVRQRAAREEVPELLLHEQHAVLGDAGLIPGKTVGHAEDVGAISGA